MLPSLFPIGLSLFAYDTNIKGIKSSFSLQVQRGMKTVYTNYISELNKIADNYIRIGKFKESEIIQNEIQINLGYLKLTSSSYNFIFENRIELPEKAENARRTRDEKIKSGLTKLISKCIQDLKLVQNRLIRTQNIEGSDEVGREIAIKISELDMIKSLNKLENFSDLNLPTPSLTVNNLLPVADNSKTIVLNDGTKLEMIFVKPGRFKMGSPVNETGRKNDEKQHEVLFTKGFFLGKYEVTQAQYKAVMERNNMGINSNPSKWNGCRIVLSNRLHLMILKYSLKN